uniref:Chalcone isomerase domain-containing protein n=1 Tax=Coccolithus braarudii TaxID=221442 RepID=A0A7S0Q024_9EUKA|mmetsp:Transcript_19395/g.41748  ORF Transcript_19395/g.41748 Transcript_19395/m.41748 type:complete len:209 (+) Transcript_19395:16-642(+)|eukprot:CAMPEP_0183355638 /NCGR_PEP_ID=MMETSP0164_2-20130417/41238_1 /TAXON_ID=221442 /ORGANISM="Coccolithus pelagicus ssp braarudi, Strain PLY182g" /LENGTH=208 /DNA_ID=CAMNT_0025528803 /DNA_START=13 /DNA_END=639 /DNA_ORIENTATION=+
MSSRVGALLLLCAGTHARVEPATKVGFKDSLNGQPLVGVGVRKKGPIKVYGIGMYVDAMGSKMSLSKYKQHESALKLPASFFEDILGGFGKTLVLKMVYGVSKEKMAGALAESIKPRMTGGLAAVSEFEQMLMDGCETHAKDGRACAGTEFQFGVRGSSLGVHVNGKKVGTINSKPLCRALLKCYFDSKSVAPALKSTSAEGLLERLH